jgi:flagellin
MTRINTNVDSIIAQHNLQRTNNLLGISLTRLSTGLRVNSGKDDPAGLIAGEFLRQEISATRSAIANNNRANNLLSTAEAALSEITNLLDDVRGVLTTAANTGVLSQDEIEANQAAIDSAISSINRIATNTQFAGRKLLDGSLGFQLSGVSKEVGVDDTLLDVRVFRASFDADETPITVTVVLDTAATQASVSLAAAAATEDSVIEVIGTKGAVTLNVGSGQSAADAINGVSDQTGVTASGATLTSIDFGENAFVTVRNIKGNLLDVSEVSDEGSDAEGRINGSAFSGDGLRATINLANLELEVTFSAGVAAATTETFQITGGGARFQLGLQIVQQSQVTIGLPSFQAGSLGHSNEVDGDRTLASIVTGGLNSILLDRGLIATQIVEEALSQVASFRSRIGALQRNTIETNINSLQVGLENLSAARSAIVDTDFASETAALTRSQILVQAGTSVLAIANARPQSVLSLLG